MLQVVYDDVRPPITSFELIFSYIVILASERLGVLITSTGPPIFSLEMVMTHAGRWWKSVPRSSTTRRRYQWGI